MVSLVDWTCSKKKMSDFENISLENLQIKIWRENIVKNKMICKHNRSITKSITHVMERIKKLEGKNV